MSTAASSPTTQLIRRLEGRLERLLDSGWRNASQEALEVAEDADAVAEAGLERLAERLRVVGAARTASDGLAAVTLALAACRLLRARLAPNPAADGEGEWSLVGQKAGRRGGRSARPAAQQDRLIPVGRMALREGEGWACLRLRGSLVSEWVLIEPFELPGETRVLRTAAGTEPAWLRTVLTGRLRWRARHPLGAEGSVERCALEDGATAEETDGDGGRLGAYRLLDQAHEALRQPWKDGAALFGGYGSVRLKRLEPGESAAYVWADEAAAEVLRGCGDGAVWGVVWKEGGAEQPLALLSPRGLLKRAGVMHLVPGRPKTPLE